MGVYHVKDSGPWLETMINPKAAQSDCTAPLYRSLNPWFDFFCMCKQESVNLLGKILFILLWVILRIEAFQGWDFI